MYKVLDIESKACIYLGKPLALNHSLDHSSEHQIRKSVSEDFWDPWIRGKYADNVDLFRMAVQDHRPPLYFHQSWWVSLYYTSYTHKKHHFIPMTNRSNFSYYLLKATICLDFLQYVLSRVLANLYGSVRSMASKGYGFWRIPWYVHLIFLLLFVEPLVLLIFHCSRILIDPLISEVSSNLVPSWIMWNIQLCSDLFLRGAYYLIMCVQLTFKPFCWNSYILQY